VNSPKAESRKSLHSIKSILLNYCNSIYVGSRQVFLIGMLSESYFNYADSLIIKELEESLYICCSRIKQVGKRLSVTARE